MKKKLLFLFIFISVSNVLLSQTNPIILGWLRNTTGITGRHYVTGNSTPIVDTPLANVQTVQYSATSVYVSTNGIPAYITGPFQDGNPSLATSQNAIFKFPLIVQKPIQQWGITTTTKIQVHLILILVYYLIFVLYILQMVCIQLMLINILL